MIWTTGSQWMTPVEGGRAWVKHVKSPLDIDLGENNGYILKCGFQDCEEPIGLNPREFLIVAAETTHIRVLGRSSSQERGQYRYMLLFVPDEKATRPVILADSDGDSSLVATAGMDALSLRVISPDHRRSLRNWLYCAGLYCYLFFTKRSGRLTEMAERVLQQPIDPLDRLLHRPRRRITRLNPAPPPVLPPLMPGERRPRTPPPPGLDDQDLYL